MRLIMTLTAAAMLAGCNRPPADNLAAQANEVEATPASNAQPIQASFDCGRARGQAQELLCSDKALAAMDREVARLAGLAAEPAGQANYALQRDNCWKADELRQCVMATAMLEIHRLRRGSESARQGDNLSAGPVAFTCKGSAGPVLATFVKGDPGAVALEWSGQQIAVDQVQGASSAQYEGRWNGQQYGFGTKDKEATFTVPGKGDLRCIEAPSN